jgi:hypothetical protein
MRPFVALLLIFSFAAARPVARARSAQDDKEPARLTPEEEKDAGVLAADFEKRISETNDIKPLIDEMFVADFAERLRVTEAPGDFIFIPVRDDVEKRLDRGDLLRAYAASMNFFFLMSRLYVVALDARTRDGRCKVDEEDEAGCEPTFSEIFPPPVMEVLERNPLLTGLAAELEKEESPNDGSQGPQDNHDERTVENVEQFHSLVATLEEAGDKMREQLKNSPSLSSTHEMLVDLRAKRVKAAENDEDSREDGVRPRLTILTKEFFGYPPGTRLICVSSVLPFHLDLVRVGGQLKVAAAYFEDD